MKFKISIKIFLCILQATTLKAECENFSQFPNSSDSSGQLMMGPNGFYDKLSFPKEMKSIRYLEIAMK
jgi:hypothetical protein